MKKLDGRLLGGILLIVGTSIGGGMLALPVSTASTGFIDSALFLVLSWLVMTLGALLVLEVNLYLPAGSNMLSMAEKTLGPIGKYLTGAGYLCLFYSLLSAYISGGSDVLQNLLSLINVPLNDLMANVLFTLGLGTIVYRGIALVDRVNRGLMFFKLGILLLLIVLISPHASLSLLSGGQLKLLSGTMLILVTSFGFASIVPSLRSYFNDDVTLLRRAILIGSLIPLMSYLAWDAVLMGVIPKAAFDTIRQSAHINTALTDTLNLSLKNIWIIDFFRTFSAICMLTAFLGVSLGLLDFLADGLKLKKEGKQGGILFLCTFFPPLMIVLMHPSAYMTALQFAGVLCVFLLLLLPSIMAYRGRYYLKLNNAYTVSGGKTLLIGTASIAISLIIFSLFD